LKGTFSLALSFAADFSARYGYCDRFGAMGLSNLLKECQQISMEHSDALGIGYHGYLRPKKLGFLLAKQRVTAREMPLGGEQLTLTTSASRAGAFYLRENRLLGLKGGEKTELARVEARWVLVDLAAVRILRRPPPEIAELFPNEAEAFGDFRVKRPENPQKTLLLRALPSLCDVNGHINNASYADLLLDALDEQIGPGRKLRELEIVYSRQILHGAEFELLCQGQDDEFLFLGQDGAGALFQARARLG
jgi:acyl-ACP thioesterase